MIWGRITEPRRTRSVEDKIDRTRLSYSRLILTTPFPLPPHTQHLIAALKAKIVEMQAMLDYFQEHLNQEQAKETVASDAEEMTASTMEEEAGEKEMVIEDV